MSLDSVLVSNVMKTDVKTENENQNVMDVVALALTALI